MPELTSPKMTSTLIAVDQLARLLHAGADVVGQILDQELDLAAQNAALLVDLGLGIFGAVDLALRQCRQDAGQRIDHADFDRLVAERVDDERRGDDLTGAERDAGFEQRATAYHRIEYRRVEYRRVYSWHSSSSW